MLIKKIIFKCKWEKELQSLTNVHFHESSCDYGFDADLTVGDMVIDQILSLDMLILLIQQTLLCGCTI